MFTKAEQKAVIIIPMVTGSISFFASAIILCMIYRSNLKLTTTYRRLICGMSIFDLIQSFSQLTSSLPLPAEWPVWGSMGDDGTCDVQGFMFVVGMSGAVLYSLTLNIYFLCVSVFNMSPEIIKRRLEPFLHFLPITFGLTGGIAVLATDNINPTGLECWIGPRPFGCQSNPNVDCEDGEWDWLKNIFALTPLALTYIGSLIILATIWWSYHRLIRRNQALTMQWSNMIEEEAQNPPRRRSSFRSRSQEESSSVLAAYLSRPSPASINRKKEIIQRCIAFTLGYMFTFSWGIVFNFWNRYAPPAPFYLLVLSKFFFPLQGFFNILVYTSPHVSAYRNQHPDHSWFHAFFEILKSGGDSDQTFSRRRRSSFTSKSSVTRRGSNVLPETALHQNDSSDGCKRRRSSFARFFGVSSSASLDAACPVNQNDEGDVNNWDDESDTNILNDEENDTNILNDENDTNILNDENGTNILNDENGTNKPNDENGTDKLMKDEKDTNKQDDDRV